MGIEDFTRQKKAGDNDFPTHFTEKGGGNMAFKNTHTHCYIDHVE